MITKSLRTSKREYGDFVINRIIPLIPSYSIHAFATIIKKAMARAMAYNLKDLGGFLEAETHCSTERVLVDQSPFDIQIKVAASQDGTSKEETPFSPVIHLERIDNKSRS